MQMTEVGDDSYWVTELQEGNGELFVSSLPEVVSIPKEEPGPLCYHHHLKDGFQRLQVEKGQQNQVILPSHPSSCT